MCNSIKSGSGQGNSTPSVSDQEEHLRDTTCWAFMEKGLTMRGSQTPVQKYWHKLLKMIEDGTVKPSIVLTHEGPLEVAPHFYKIFDNKEDGCIRVRP